MFFIEAFIAEFFFCFQIFFIGHFKIHENLFLFCFSFSFSNFLNRLEQSKSFLDELLLCYLLKYVSHPVLLKLLKRFHRKFVRLLFLGKTHDFFPRFSSSKLVQNSIQELNKQCFPCYLFSRPVFIQQSVFSPVQHTFFFRWK